MTKDEALRLALEALGWTDEWRPQGLKEEAITAIKAALEAPQRTWVGLTDEEILVKCESVPDYDIGNHDLIQFAQAIQAKLKDKNT